MPDLDSIAKVTEVAAGVAAVIVTPVFITYLTMRLNEILYVKSNAKMEHQLNSQGQSFIEILGAHKDASYESGYSSWCAQRLIVSDR